MQRVYEFRIWDKLLNKMINYHPWITIDNTLVLMQFTGFYDKQGVKVFEGDYVQMMNSAGYYIIAYDTRIASYTASGFPLNTGTGRFIDTKNVSVQGNIYENPKFSTLKR